MIIFDENLKLSLLKIWVELHLILFTCNSVEIFNQMMNPLATEADILSMISMSSEFDSIKIQRRRI